MLRPSPLRRNREYDRNKKMEVSSVRYPRGHAIVQLSVSIVVAVTNYYPGAVVIIVWLQTSNCRRDGGRDGEREKEYRLTNRLMIAVSFVIVRDNMMTGIDLFGGVFYFYYRPEFLGRHVSL